MASIAIVVSLVAPSAHAATVAVGTANTTFAGCPVGSDKLAIAGVSDGSTWVFNVGDANSANTACAFASAEATYAGAWNPAVGGCMASQISGAPLCLTNPGAGGTYSIFACFDFGGFCVSGTATLTLA